MLLTLLFTPSRCCVKDKRDEWNREAKANYTPIPEDYYSL